MPLGYRYMPALRSGMAPTRVPGFQPRLGGTVPTREGSPVRLRSPIPTGYLVVPIGRVCYYEQQTSQRPQDENPSDRGAYKLEEDTHGDEDYTCNCFPHRYLTVRKQPGQVYSRMTGNPSPPRENLPGLLSSYTTLPQQPGPYYTLPH